MAESKVKTAKTRRVHCNHCRRDTIHGILRAVTRPEAWLVRERHEGMDNDEEKYEYLSSTDYEMLRCRGCEEVVLRREYLFSEDPESTISFFPPPASRWVPSWRWTLPDAMGCLLDEVYIALQANSLTLAMMGARTVIDTAIVQKVGDQGTFEEKLKALQ